MKYPYLEVTVIYDNLIVDGKFKYIASKCNGKFISSGQGTNSIGEDSNFDMTFKFFDLKNARKFINKINKFKCVQHITSKAYMSKDDVLGEKT